MERVRGKDAEAAAREKGAVAAEAVPENGAVRVKAEENRDKAGKEAEEAIPVKVSQVGTDPEKKKAFKEMKRRCNHAWS